MFYIPNTPFWLRMLFPADVVWKGKPDNNTVYLTFDDGPTPEVTAFVLEQLEKHQVKATFFCIGDNVALYPEIFRQVQAEGHRVGNHTMHHSNGWKTDDDAYLQEIKEADQLIGSNLFRPPYGRIKASQHARLKKMNPDHQTIMWSVIAGDFDEKIDGNTSFQFIKSHTKPGSIIVFHDSVKAFPRLKIALPLTLEWLREQGFRTAML
jgi:peptidoglycan/xylan/chitin deacetylase (PgdA/CDA1 family)